MNKLLSIFALILCFNTLFAQRNDAVLFTINGKPTYVSDFNYIYLKNNGAKADYSRKSLDEYLDLYTKFKLKVQQARDMKIDSIPSLRQELNGYRRQLADSYLMDKEVLERLTREAFDRKKQDVDINHLFIAVPQNAAVKDTLIAFNKAQDVIKQLKAGKKFEDLVKQFSDDKSAKGNGGHLGYLTAMLPNGFYELESAVYSTPKGKTSGVIRSNVGYHVVRVNDVRPARGEMEVAHILIRKAEGQPTDPKAKEAIDAIYKKLADPIMKFEEVARTASQDEISAPSGGNIGAFGIGQYEGAFEDAAFALAKNGDFSKPVETSIGWHIIKRISKKSDEPYESMRRNLQEVIQKDTRYNIAKASVLNRIKMEAEYTEYKADATTFIKSLDSQFLTYAWKGDRKNAQRTLFTLGKSTFTLGDFITYIEQNPMRRMQLGTGDNMEFVASTIYQEFVNSKAMEYEEARLGDKYPEYRSLLNEYEEGILLFETAKQKVWDKASQDTVGLKKFFALNQAKYKWDERIAVANYTFKGTDEKEIENIRKFAKKNTVAETLKKFSTDKTKGLLSSVETVVEKGKNPILDKLSWKKGTSTDASIDKMANSTTFQVIQQVIPAGPKMLKDARGYAVADYQDYLEKEWVSELRSKYKVEINKENYEKMVK
jgi:peptidyl-prolyl cis-trans isomerase SurA